MVLTGRSLMMVRVIWMDIGLALLFIGLRTFTRDKIAGRLGWDDALLWSSWFLYAIFAAFTTLACTYGFGQHMDNLTKEQATNAWKFAVISQSFAPLAILTSKAAVAGFLLRIVNIRWHKIALWSTIVIVTIVFLFDAVVNIFQCVPISGAWMLGTKAKCWIKIVNVTAAAFGLSIIADFFLAALPWFIVHNLQMSKIEKRTIGFSLSVGVLAGICGIIRMINFLNIGNSRDLTFDASAPMLWTFTELLLTMFCLCFPALRPLYRRVLGRSPNSSSNNTGPSSYRLQSYTTRNNGTTATRSARHSRGFSEVVSSTIKSRIRKDEHEIDSDDAVSTQSKEKILGSANYMGITHTREVTLSFSPRKSEDGVATPTHGI